MTLLPSLLPRISDYAAWQAVHRPDAEALVLGTTRLTYRELDRGVDRLARALLAAGVTKGDRVATLQTPHPDFVLAFLATASIGAIWVGLNPRYRFAELEHVIRDAEPQVLLARTRIGDRSYQDDILGLVDACPGLRQVVIFDADPVPVGAEPMQQFLGRGDAVDAATLAAARASCGGRDPCLIVYTSGTSGTPKGALLHHDGIAAFSLAQNEVWPVQPLRLINFLPINHIGCVIDCTTPCLVAGGTMFFMEHFDAEACLQLMQDERVTVWGSLPSVFQMQLALPDFGRYDLGALQLIIWEGAALPVELIERLLQICPRLATNYGLTEATSAVTVVEPTDDLDVLANSVGRAFPGVEIRLADSNGAPVGEGTPGEIQTRSRYNFLGYWRRPKQTAEAFTADGFFRTGDLAVRRPDGRYRIVGRLKEMYKSGGYNVYPREVEAALEAHPAAALAVVVSTADPVWQEVGVAYVVPAAVVTPMELEAHCRARLANYKIPKRIVIEPNLPQLPNGKIDKRALKKRASEDR